MEHLSKALAAVSRVGEVISRTAQSAQELLRDQELRSKGIQTVISGAQTRLQGIQNGIVQRAGRIQERLLDNRRQLQVLLQTLEERFNASQRAWQLQARRRDRVDVQFGRQIIENAPQEIRARLWYVLLENPHLAAPLKCENPGVALNSLSEDEVEESEDLIGGVGPGPSLNRRSVGARDAAQMASAGSISSTGNRFTAAAAAALGFGRSSGAESSMENSPSAISLNNGARRDRSVSGRTGAMDASPDVAQLSQQIQALQPYGRTSATGTPQSVRALRAGGLSAATEAAAAAAATDGPGDSLDGWEIVSGVLGTTDPSGLPGSSGSGPAGPPQPEAIRLILERLDALGHLALDESGSDPVLVAQQAVLEAMLQVPWEIGVGLPLATALDSRFAVLNEMTAGQEEVDDSILRDIHRTFPEHPYFGMEAGQRSLFRVLKAYSLHDLEVAYCQGMAFMAGVLLMYVPEEMAFRLFCRLMDSEGPNLRRLYLPGLEPLKAELATFELLLSWRMPELATHLSDFGLPPVLYVSQWLMTLFATPFPPAFCARVIDVLLQDGHDRLLLRCSFAVVEALEAELLGRHDFEALITYLKMEPVTWGLSRQRAIMERALTSPLTDAEIDVARDTVANRKILAAALAASTAAEAAGTSESIGDADPSIMTGGELHGRIDATASVVADPAAVMQQRKCSLEAEVDATLTMAAAAALTVTDGDMGRSSADLWELEFTGRGGLQAHASGIDTAVIARESTRACREGQNGWNMISFDDEEGIAPLPAAAAAGPSSGDSGSCRGSSAERPGQRWEPEWPVRMLPTESGHGLGGAESASGVGCSSSSRQACGGGSSYGMSPSLLDDIDFSCGSGGTGRRPKASDLEYGEYGEMLMDAGLLLPELGAVDGTGASPMAAAAAATTSSGGEGLLAPPGLGLGGSLHRLHGQVQSGTDLLLD